MADGRHPPAALVRPEFEVQPGEAAPIGDVARPLATWERINNNPFTWCVVILVILAAVWELYAHWLHNPLLFPAFSEMAAALWDATVRGPLIERTLTTIRVLLMGYAAGIALAAVFTTLAVSTRLGTHLSRMANWGRVPFQLRHALVEGMVYLQNFCTDVNR